MAAVGAALKTSNCQALRLTFELNPFYPLAQSPQPPSHSPPSASAEPKCQPTLRPPHAHTQPTFAKTARCLSLHQNMPTFYLFSCHTSKASSSDTESNMLLNVWQVETKSSFEEAKRTQNTSLFLISILTRPVVLTLASCNVLICPENGHSRQIL